MTIPDWVYDRIFYQIFPDRFANGDQTNDPPNKQPWGTLPDTVHFQGGDLAGIQQKLDYLGDLGVNAIYLNPIFLSPSSHRYNTVNYYAIDPKLGSLDEFNNFLKTAHRKGFRVILDGVFNHCGRGFFAFNDVLENEADSPYYNWFHINRFPLQAYTPGKSTNYTAWWGYKSLPKFNTDYAPVRKYIFDVAKFWVDQGIDGWRLDVPNEINDDSFWAEFRQVVRAANPNAYLVGEIWEVDSRWVGENHFDGLMNYPLRKAILGLINDERDGDGFIDDTQQIIKAYPYENVLAMYSLLGSHDVERPRTLFGGSVEKTCLAFTLLFGLPGVPSIYYGDEIGMEGDRDPDCRRAFPWDERKWSRTLQEHIRLLAQIRMAYSSLRRGEIIWPEKGQVEGGVAWIRSLDSNQKILITANPSGKDSVLRLIGLPTMPVEGKLPNLLDETHELHIALNQVSAPLPAWGAGMYLLPD
ncbi:MAG: glycoside hydrolase family 13 protein [Bellilinea sp.]